MHRLHRKQARPVEPFFELPPTFRNEDVFDDLAEFEGLADSLAFVLLEPWAVHAGKAPTAVRVLRDAGFRVLAFRYVRLSDGDVEQVYRKEVPISMEQHCGFDLLQRSRTIGTSCGLLLFHPEPRPSATAMVNEMKGKALLPSWSMRRVLRAPNNTIDLLHTSDDWRSTIHEAAVVFSPRQLRRTLEGDLEAVAADAERRFSEAGYDGLETVAERSATALLVAARRRIDDLLAAETGISSPPPLRELWAEYAGRDLLALDVVAEAAEYLELVEEEREPLAELLDELALAQPPDWFPRIYVASPDVRGLATALRVLNRPELYDRVDYDALVAGAPVFLDRWELLLLETTLHHFPELVAAARL